MTINDLYHEIAESRTPHGVRGLKYPQAEKALHLRGGRTPHGVRGLK